MTVTDRDKAVMRRIGEFKAASHSDRLAEHLSLSLEERLRKSWRLFEALRDSVPDMREDDDPAAFYDRAHRERMDRTPGT